MSGMVHPTRTFEVMQAGHKFTTISWWFTLYLT